MVPVTGLRNTCTLDNEVKDEMERKRGQQRLRSCQAAEAGVTLWLPVFGDFGVRGWSFETGFLCATVLAARGLPL